MEKIDPFANAPVLNLDRERRFCMDVNAFDALGEELKINPFDGEQLQPFIDRPTPKFIRALLWSGLLRDDPEITLKAAGGLVGPKDLMAIGKQLVATLIAQNTPVPGTPSAEAAVLARAEQREGGAGETAPKDPPKGDGAPS